MEQKSLSINNLRLSYIDNCKQDSPVVLFLHGWAADKYNMRLIYDGLADSCRIVSLDLPGFGGSDEPGCEWGTPEYSVIVSGFIDALGITGCTVVGHSFGGKIAFYTAALKPQLFSNIILIAPSVLRNRRSPVYYLKVWSYKLMKRVCMLTPGGKRRIEALKSRSGSEDYKNASPVMRQILVRIVNEDFGYLSSRIVKPLFLYWGDRDDALPVSMAYRLNRSVPDSGLFVVKGGGHFPFVDDNRIINIIKSLIAV